MIRPPVPTPSVGLWSRLLGGGPTRARAGSSPPRQRPRSPARARRSSHSVRLDKRDSDDDDDAGWRPDYAFLSLVDKAAARTDDAYDTGDDSSTDDTERSEPGDDAVSERKDAPTALPSVDSREDKEQEKEQEEDEAPSNREWFHTLVTMALSGALDETQVEVCAFCSAPFRGGGQGPRQRINVNRDHARAACCVWQPRRSLETVVLCEPCVRIYRHCLDLAVHQPDDPFFSLD